MKEVMAIVRQNKVNITKNALEKADFPAFTCRKVLGRGKQAGQEMLIQPNFKTSEETVQFYGQISHTQNLIPKRVFTLVVRDDEVQKAVNAIMEVNSTGNTGDGKIFVLPISEAIRVRDGKEQMDSESY
jgi:nitrogen regulatory protein PII 2